MSALSAAQAIVMQGSFRDIAQRPVLASTKIHKGAMVGITAAGFARPFASGDFFAGHALEEADNTTGASAAINVDCLRGTYTLTVPVVDSITVAHTGDNVGAASDNHADLTRTTDDRVGSISAVTANGVQVTFQTFEVAGISAAVQAALDLKADA